MSPNQTPSPGVTSPNFNSPNLGQQYRYQNPNPAGPGPTSMPQGATNAASMPQVAQSTQPAVQDSVMKRYFDYTLLTGFVKENEEIISRIMA